MCQIVTTALDIGCSATTYGYEGSNRGGLVLCGARGTDIWEFCVPGRILVFNSWATSTNFHPRLGEQPCVLPIGFVTRVKD